MNKTDPFMRSIAIAALVSCASIAAAADFHAGSIDVSAPYAIATPPGATTGAGYLEVVSNQGSAEDRLVGVETPVADHVELHTMSMDGDTMRMRQVPAIVVPPGGRVAMAPGHGHHLMLVGLKRPLKVGETIAMTLRFDRAGVLELTLPVRERGAAGATTHMH